VSGEVRNAAWLCSPQTNRLLVFKGDRLHGVIPHIHQSCRESQHDDCLTDSILSIPPTSRITLMIGWWGNGVSTTPSPSLKAVAKRSFTPNMRLPTPGTAPWLPFLAPIELTASPPSSLPKTHLIPVIGDVWEPVTASPSSSTALKHRDTKIVCVGNWFLKDRSEILNEVFPNRQRRSEGDNEIKDGSSSEAVEWISLDELKKLRGG
jgi:hypothetical protein